MPYPEDGSIIFCRRWKGDVTRKECAACWDKSKKRAMTRLACRLNEINANTEAGVEA